MIEGWSFSYVVDGGAHLHAAVVASAEELAVRGDEGGSDLVMVLVFDMILWFRRSCLGFFSYRDAALGGAELCLLDGDGETLCVVHGRM